MEGLENYNPKQAGNTQTPVDNKQGFLDKAKQFLKVMNDASVRGGSFGLENRIRAGEAAGAGAIRRHLPDSVNGLIDKANSVPVLNHVIQPFEDAGPQSLKETQEQTRDRVSKQLNAHDTQESKDNPIASTAGTLAGSLPATIATTGAGTTLGNSALVGRGLNVIKNASSVGKVGDVVAGTTQAAIKTVPNVAENAAYSAGTDTSDDSITHKLERGALVGAATSPFGVLGTTAAKLGGGLAAVGAEGAGAVFNKALGSGAARGAGSEIGNVVVDKDNQQTTDSAAAQSVDTDALLKSLNINPDTPDGAQKAAALSPPDHSDLHKNDEGTVSEDVPQVSIVNGRKVLTTPNGQTIQLD